MGPVAGAAPGLRISAAFYQCAASGNHLPLPSPPLPRLDDAVAAPVRVPIADTGSYGSERERRERLERRRLLAELQDILEAPAADIEAERQLVVLLWGRG